MNQLTSENQQKTNSKTPIIILSLISLACGVLCSINCFVYYEWVYNNGNDYYKLTVGFSDGFISYIILLVPYVLFALYIFKFHNKYKAAIIVPITFFLLAVPRLITLVTRLNLSSYRYYGTIYLLIDIFFIVAFVLAAISALQGFSKKVFLIIAMAVVLIMELSSIISFFQSVEFYVEKELYLEFFYIPVNILGRISFYLALLLFGLKNKIPAIISISSKREKEKMNPEQALKLLKDKLDFGAITEEEYQVQRTEIISKL